MTDITGTPGGDTLVGGPGDDLIVGGSNLPDYDIIHTIDGAAPNGPSTDPIFTPDGTRIVFQSLASNLVAGDTNNAQDIFVEDLTTGEITRVSTSATGAQSSSGGFFGADAVLDAVSPNGDEVAFHSYAQGLVDGTSGDEEFVKSISTGVISVASTPIKGGGLLQRASSATFTPDGTGLAFSADYSFFDKSYVAGLFLKNLVTGEISLLSSDASGAPADSGVTDAVFTKDGSDVIFESAATNLIPGATTPLDRIYIKEISTGHIKLLLGNPEFSPDPNAGPVNIYYSDLHLTGDGLFLYVTERQYAQTSAQSAPIVIKDLVVRLSAGDILYQLYDFALTTHSSDGSQGAGVAPDASGGGHHLELFDLPPGEVRSLGPADNAPISFAPVSMSIAATQGGDIHIFSTNQAGSGDILTGGAGADTFKFTSVADSPGFNPDTITDFVHGQDKIDLTGAAGGMVALQHYANGHTEVDYAPNSLGYFSGAIQVVGDVEAPDIIVDAGTTFTIIGSQGPDHLTGGPGNDVIYGGYGFTSGPPEQALGYVQGSPDQGGNVLSGGAGDDTLITGGPNDVLDGGPGADHLYGLFPGAFLLGGDGNDVIQALDGFNAPAGGPGSFLIGGAGDDTIIASNQDDVIQGGDGNDSITVGDGSASIDGGAGYDTVSFGGLAAHFYIDLKAGTENNGRAPGDGYQQDTLVSIEHVIVQGAATVVGSDGADWIQGDVGNPSDLSPVNFSGGAGDDKLEGGYGDDILSGGDGADILNGGPGHNLIDGGAGFDTAVYSLTLAVATVSEGADGTVYVNVPGVDGGGAPPVDTADTLTNVEVLQFADGTIYTAQLGTVATQYEALVGRAPSSGELSYWTTALNGGTATADQLGQVLAGTDSGKAHLPELVSSFYELDLGRAASSAEVSYWSGALQNGSTDLAGLEGALAGQAGAAAQAALTVDLLYRTFLGREASSAETGYWTGVIGAGTTDLSQAERLFSSFDTGGTHEGAAVTGAYETILGRNPSSGEVTYWTGRLGAGSVSTADLGAILLGTADGQAHTSGAVQGLYATDLGRAASGDEVGYWQGRLAAGATDYNALNDLLQTVSTAPNVHALSGTAAADSFAFSATAGHLVISGFDPAMDTVHLTGSALAGFDPLAHAVQTTAGDGFADVLVTYDVADTILFKHVALSSLSAGDFIQG